MDTEIEVFKTPDIGLASSLLTSGFDVIGIDVKNPKRAFFYFKNTAEIEVAADSYWRGELKVNAKEMSNNRRELVTRLHDELYASGSSKGGNYGRYNQDEY